MALTFPHASSPPRAEPLLDSVDEWTARNASRHLRVAEPDRVDVTLVTEGTYPFARGGVSVWCDQVVSGLSELSFRVAALAAFRHQQPSYELPGHVEDFRRIGLWDGTPRYRAAGHRPVAPLARLLASLLTAPDDDVTGFRSFLDSLTTWSDAEVRGQLWFGELLHALDQEVVRTPRWWALQGVRVADLVQVAEMLDHLLRTLTFDIGPAAVHHATSNGLAALACMLATRRHGGQFLLSEHGVYLRERYLELRRLPLARPAKALLLRFHRLVTAASYVEASVISPCSDWNQRWERRFGARPSRLRTVHNGIDPDRFPPRPADADDPGPVVAWLGRVDPLKDLETLIRAFRIVGDKRPDARLRLFGLTPAGNEGYRAEMDDLVAELDLGDLVTFEGGVAHGTAAYGQALICVLSSISEGFPYALIEGMACGLASVATGVGGVAEAVTDDVGIVVLPRSPDLLGAAVLELLDDPERCRTMGSQARRRVLDRFTLDRCLDGYRSLYRQLAEEGDHERASRTGAGTRTVAGAATAAGEGARYHGHPGLPGQLGHGHHGNHGHQRRRPVSLPTGRTWRVGAVRTRRPAVPYVVAGLTAAVRARVGGAGAAGSAGGLAGVGAAAGTGAPLTAHVVGGAPGPNGTAAGDAAGGRPAAGARGSDRPGGEPRPLDPADYDSLVAAVGGLEALHAAVDVEEVAATLESVGVTDKVAIQSFDTGDVFELAERVWAQSERGQPPEAASAARATAAGGGGEATSRPGGSGRPAGSNGSGGPGGGGRPPSPRPEPVLPSARGALPRGLAYVLPAVAVAAASLQGTAQVALVAASVAGWGLAQGGGALAYTVLNRSPTGSGLRPLRRAFLGCVAAVVAAGLVTGALTTPTAGAALALPLLYLVSSCALIMAGRTWRLLGVLVPATGVSLAALAAPDRGAAALVPPVAAATVLVSLLLVAREVRGRGTPKGPRLLHRDDLVAAGPMVACGWLSAGCAVLSVRSLAQVDGLVGVHDRVWLLLALPLWTMVVGNEWLLIGMRRSLRSLLHATATVADFRAESLWIVAGWLLAAAAVLTTTVLLAMAVAGLPALAAWQASSVFLYVSLAFVGVTLLYTTPRVGPALAVQAATVTALAVVTATPGAPLGIADHTLALLICASAALVLCRTAALTLADPASHR